MTFSVIDVETTGLSARGGDRILEIGVAQLDEDGRIADVLDTLVNPGRQVRATHVHGITDAMVRDAPRFRDIAAMLISVLDGTVVAAHNAAFDTGFLTEEFRRAGMALPAFRSVCTLNLARRYLNALPSRSLASCRRFLGLPDEGAHNALADARAAAAVLHHLMVRHDAIIDAEPFSGPSVDPNQLMLPDLVDVPLKSRITLGDRA